MGHMPFTGKVWRVHWNERDACAGGTGGGRWGRANEFETLYTSVERDGALAEIYHHLARAPVFADRPVVVSQINISLHRTLRLNDKSLAALGLHSPDFSICRSQEVGAAARFLDIEALLVPSLRWPCENAVIFPDRLSQDSSLAVAASEPINWPAWREQDEVRSLRTANPNT